MTSAAIHYEKAPVTIRPELPEAHDRAWRRLAQPGRWWTGAQRVALAAEVRKAWSCPLCRSRKGALSPQAVSGEHARSGGAEDLPPAAVDAVHRITTDPGRLSRSFYAQVRAGGLEEGHYVELVGVVATLVSIDAFCRGLGLPLRPLPEPAPGEPSRDRPAGVEDRGAWVPMAAGFGGNVLRALSLVPEEVENLLDLSAAHYLPMEQMVDVRQGRASLSRAQIELVAARVSALRECFY